MEDIETQYLLEKYARKNFLPDPHTVFLKKRKLNENNILINLKVKSHLQQANLLGTWQQLYQ